MSTSQYVNVERTLYRLDTELDPTNADAIRAFIDHCAAEGISEVRQERLASAWKTLLTNVAPDGFVVPDASEDAIEQLIAGLNRADYTPSTKHTMRCAVKKFYKVENGGHTEPEKTKFFSVGNSNAPTVTRDDLFPTEELQRLFQSFTSTRDRAMALVFYEAAARPGELLALNIGDFTANEQGDFIFLQGLKNTPDRTNQLVRAGRTVREWLAQHPLGGELGAIIDPSAPLWVKTEQQTCAHCGEIPHHHDDACDYAPDHADRLPYGGFYRRYQAACERANIPKNRRRPYNLRHTRLTEVATFMGYEQLNKFAGWHPGSDRAKVYVHLTNDDVNQAIRDQHGLGGGANAQSNVNCPFCGATNQPDHTECRQCGRPLSLEHQARRDERLQVLDRLAELEEKGLLDKLDRLEDLS